MDQSKLSSALDSLLQALPVKLNVRDTRPIPEAKFVDGKITLPFLHDVTTVWDWADLDPANPNDVPNLNLTVMGLILASNAEVTRGASAWTQTENTLAAIGFTNMAHRYFEGDEKINCPAMVFGRSTVQVKGKYVVAAVYRGSSSLVDAISDIKAEPGGFHEAGINATNELRSYCRSQGLTKENTILFITGHSYGAATTSLVTIMSTDLAERDSIFGYSFATPNYIRHGLTGDGMKMFSFDSNEDVVPQVPVGPGLDKTGVCIKYDRLDYQLNDPARYARFEKLYEYFRGKSFEADSDFMPEEYTGNRGLLRLAVNTEIVRNHMPYTYMALILSALEDEAACSYIAIDNSKASRLSFAMTAGEAYKLPDGFAWKSSDVTVASVSEQGMLSAVSAGTATLTATTEDGRSAVLEVQVKP